MEIMLIPIFLGLLGLFIGSFLNVVIDRLPLGKSIALDRSRCDFCNQTLRWFELIPVFSFLLQGGKCLRCHKKLSVQYPLMEIVTGILFFVISFYTYSNIQLLVSAIIIACCLLIILGTDLKAFFIPDSAILFLLIGTVIYHFGISFSLFFSYLLAGLGATLVMYTIYIVTKKKGMGFGDVKFSFFLGFFLGFPDVIASLYLAFLTGAFVGVILILIRSAKLKTRIPFGPFLILGFIGSILLYEQIHAIFSTVFWF